MKKWIEILVQKIYLPTEREVLFRGSKRALPQSHGMAYLPNES